jgi:membrane protein
VSEQKESFIPRMRRRYPWFDHWLRAYGAFTERYGNHYAAAITYFSVLSVVPIMMVGFAIAGFVLAGDPELLAGLQQAITEEAPAGMGDTLNEVVEQAVDSRAAVGVLGLLTAVYAGVGWMSNLRDALTAQWGHPKPEQPLITGTLKDLLALAGLGLALALSFGLSALGAGAGDFLLEAVGLADQGWARVLFTALTVVLSVAANWLVFIWVIARLPREQVTLRSAVKGALIAAVGFEILKALATLFLGAVTNSPTGALFGPIIGLLVFANLVARFLLLVTAWTATATENLPPEQPSEPVVVKVEVRRGPSAGDVAGLLGVGGLLGAGLARLRRRR